MAEAKDSGREAVAAGGGAMAPGGGPPSAQTPAAQLGDGERGAVAAAAVGSCGVGIAQRGEVAPDDLQGFVDGCDGASVQGWAWDRTDPARTVVVAIYVDERLVAEVPADGFRADLLSVDAQHPHHAFDCRLPGERALPLRQGTLTVKFAGTDRALTPSGGACGLVNRPPLNHDDLIYLMAHNALQPSVPQALMDHIAGPGASAFSFRIVGAGIVLDLLAYGLLRLPPGTVVDLGCGCGRVGIQMAPWFVESGAYWGFDTWAEGIRWAQDAITSTYPNVQFRALGTTSGYAADAAYELPLAAGSVDAVLAASLFTHLTDRAARAYLREIARLLRSGGGAYLTFFLWDAESQARLGATRLEPVPGGVRFDHPAWSDFFYEEAAVLDMVRAAGLVPVIREFGTWRGDHYRSRRHAVGHQDLLIVRKP